MVINEAGPHTRGFIYFGKAFVHVARKQEWYR